MKKITLHPVSVLVGLALTFVLVVLTGAAQSPGTFKGIPSSDVRVVGQIPAEWWTYVSLTTITNGGTNTRQDSYAVPTDRLFVVTASVLADTMTANGASINSALVPTNLSIPPGSTRYVLAPGAVLTIPPCQGNCSQSSTGHLWGYLEPVH